MPEEDAGTTGSVADPAVDRTVFRLPRTAYLIVLFLLVGVVPFAFSGGTSHAGGGVSDSGSAGSFSVSPLAALFVVPVAVAFFVARTATVVDARGITVRALFGSRLMPWGQVRGLAVRGATVYASLDDGAVRLPCVQVKNLAAVSAASGEHLPALRESYYRQPPVRRRRG